MVASAVLASMPNPVSPAVSAASCTPIPPGTGAVAGIGPDLHDDE